MKVVLTVGIEDAGDNQLQALEALASELRGAVAEYLRGEKEVGEGVVTGRRFGWEVDGVRCYCVLEP